MRLCLQIGCTLDELAQRMSGYEFGLWKTLWRLDPWGAERDNLHTAVIAAEIANMAGKTLKQGARIERIDYMLFRDRDDEVANEPDPVAFFKAQQNHHG